MKSGAEEAIELAAEVVVLLLVVIAALLLLLLLVLVAALVVTLNIGWCSSRRASRTRSGLEGGREG